MSVNTVEHWWVTIPASSDPKKPQVAEVNLTDGHPVCAYLPGTLMIADVIQTDAGGDYNLGTPDDSAWKDVVILVKRILPPEEESLHTSGGSGTGVSGG